MSPPVVDDRRIEHDKPPAADSGADARPPAIPQFTLGGLFLSFTGITVGFSLVVTGVKAFSTELGAIVGSCGLAVIWIVLYTMYRRLKLRAAIRWHWIGLVVIVALSVLPSLGALVYTATRATPDSFSLEFLLGLVVTVGFGFLLGSILSLLVFARVVGILIFRAVVRRLRHRGRT